MDPVHLTAYLQRPFLQTQWGPLRSQCPGTQDLPGFAFTQLPAAQT